MKGADAHRRLARMLGPTPAVALDPAPSLEDWQTLIAVGSGTLVAPSLHPTLARAGALAQVPDDVAGYLRTLTELNAERNAMLLEDLAALVRRCNDAGVRPRLLKGAALLASGVYADPGERVLGDLDLLVPEAAVKRVRELLYADGYRDVSAEPSRHHLPPLAHPQRCGTVELHWRIVGSARGLAVLDAVATALAQPWRATDIGGMPAERPTATLHAAHRFVHDMAHDPGYARGWLPLRGMLDVYRLSQHEGIDWTVIGRAALDHGLASEWRAYRHALQHHFPVFTHGAPASLGARLWFVRFQAHQRWPALYAATRWAFQRLRSVVPQRWLRYWGW